MGLKSYINNIKETLDSSFEGMGITLSNMFKRPVTFDYHSYGDKKRMPKSLAKAGLKDYSDTISEGYRGVLEVDTDTCTGCSLCEKACPIDIINIVKGKNEDKRIVVERFAIDNTRCMYCGLCSIPCPTGAIQHTKVFEASNYYLENLVYEWAGEEGYVAYNKKKDGEKERAELGSKIKDKLIEATLVPDEFFPIKVKPPKKEKVKFKAPPIVSGNRKTRKPVEVEEPTKDSKDASTATSPNEVSKDASTATSPNEVSKEVKKSTDVKNSEEATKVAASTEETKVENNNNPTE